MSPPPDFDAIFLSNRVPEIASFYTQEVIAPGNALVRRILERGVARGEVRELDLDSACHSIIAPMIFLTMWKHSLGPCCAVQPDLDPKAFILAQADILVHGLLKHPSPSQPT